ncbi:MFS transporter [Nocardia sp. NPDC057440]|uniref:MFS transporter n=1 Tax=Nocardia sp. NPDC057440 TaxID=3346134 RepID=UPI00366D4392
MLFKGIGDLIPLYALYALLFADHGLNTGQISSLFAIWSTTAFLLEVPSGAWADTVSRRALLVLSGVLLTAGFAAWTLVPTYLGFAAGFVLWGVSGALQSGTFEALLYDELAAQGERAAYPRILGYARAASEAAIVIAIVAATPLYIWGGYALLGWSSVGVAATHTLIGLSLPGAPKSVSAAAVEDLEDDAAEADPPHSPRQYRSAPGIDSSTTSVVVFTADAEDPEHDVAANDSAQSPASGRSVASTEIPTTTDGSTTTAVGIRPAESVQPTGVSNDRAAMSDGRAVVVDVAECGGGPDRPAALSTSRSAAQRGRSTVSRDAVPAAPGSPVSGPFAEYLTMLRTGVGEAIRVRAVRNGVLLGALLSGITAFDEYFALLAESVGVSTAVVPLLVGVTVLGSLIGSMSAGRTEAMAARTMAIAVGVGGVLFSGGALVAGLAIRWPSAVYVLAGIGFTAIGVSYGIVYNASIVAGARLQDAIEGPARATVTSVSGLASEVVALAVFGFAAVAAPWLSIPATVALLGATILPIALATPSWLPRRRAAD